MTSQPMRRPGSSDPTPFLGGKPPSLMVVLMGILLVISGTTNLPMQYQLGGVTGTAAFSVLSLIPLLGVALSWYLFTVDRAVFRATLPFILLIFLAASSFIWYRISMEGVQSLVIMCLLASSVSAGARLVVTGPENARRLMAWLEAAGWISLFFYSLTYFFGALATRVGIENRPFAMFALLVLSWTLPKARYFDPKALFQSGVLILFIVLSLGRTAMAIALILLLVSRMNWGVRGMLNSALALLIVGSAGMMILRYDPIETQFQRGDLQSVGGVQVNMAGRSRMWAITFVSALDSPVWGKGLGSSRAVLSRLHGKASHVHNEYLRFWHDHGIPGVTLLLFGLGNLGFWSARGLRRAREDEVRIHHLTALFALFVLAGQMMTANPLQYVFFVIPFGLLAGISYRLAISEEKPTLPPLPGSSPT